MSEMATRKEIRELYSIVRRCGIDPSVYAKKLKEERGFDSLNQLTKSDISELIAQFKHYKKNSETPTINSERQEKSVDELEEALNEIDELFRKCVEKASDIVWRTTSANLTEQAKLAGIIEIAKLYFEEVKEVKVAKVVKE